MGTDTDQASRNRALVVLALAVVIAVIAWFLIRQATEAGLNRLERLDVVRAQCDSLHARARSSDDSLRISMTALSDTIDAQSNDAIRTCGDLAKAK